MSERPRLGGLLAEKPIQIAATEWWMTPVDMKMVVAQLVSQISAAGGRDRIDAWISRSSPI